jgi:hypothetical protein
MQQKWSIPRIDIVQNVKFSSLSNPLELCSDHFIGQRCQPGGINKDPTIWIDGARLPLKYIFKF